MQPCTRSSRPTVSCLSPKAPPLSLQVTWGLPSVTGWYLGSHLCQPACFPSSDWVQFWALLFSALWEATRYRLATWLSVLFWFPATFQGQPRTAFTYGELREARASGTSRAMIFIFLTLSISLGIHFFKANDSKRKGGATVLRDLFEIIHVQMDFFRILTVL